MGQHLLKGFSIGKEIINKMKKIFVNHISNKGLASKIYKEPIQLNMNIKTSQLWAKTGKGLYRDISPKKICISPIDT